jgi:hypothetical protein
MNRRTAYFGAFKFFFQTSMAKGVDARAAWTFAKNNAAAYIFLAPTENLRMWVPVWCR